MIIALCREAFIKLVCDQNVPADKSIITTTGDSKIIYQYVSEKATSVVILIFRKFAGK